MFSNKKFLPQAEKERSQRSVWGKLMIRAKRNSLLYFGIPCFAMMFLGLQFMADFNTVRYEQHDRRLKEVSQEEALKQHGNKRRVDMREEFYRLQHIDLDNWEQKRVRRLPGESDNKW